MKRGSLQVVVLVLLAVAGLPPCQAAADWPMAAHDPQRTSRAEEEEFPPSAKPVWHRKIKPYIPTKSHVITVNGNGKRPDMLYVATVAGLHALSPGDGKDVWTYTTHMPLDHSPTFVDNPAIDGGAGTLYLACTDGTVHAVNATSGQRIWRTKRAGAPFDTNPVVVNGRIYVGGRDGFFYCFDADDGKLVWTYEVGAPISYSPAYKAGESGNGGVIYFAAHNARAYALDADNGRLIWKSRQLPGEGFYSFWPVVAGDRVIFAGSNYYHIVGSGMGTTKLEKLTRLEVWPKGVKKGDLPGEVDADGWIDATLFVKYLNQHPQRRTMHVLDTATGKEVEVAPVLWWGNPSGNRYPPAIGPGGIVWTNGPHMYSPDFCKGRVIGWKPGTTKLFPLPAARSGLDSNDEPAAISIVGRDHLYYNHKGDQLGAVYSMSGKGTLASWRGVAALEAVWPDYYNGTVDFQYGDRIEKGWAAGTHGNVNPPVPLKGKVYCHRSNAVMCFGPGSAGGRGGPPRPRRGRPTPRGGRQ